MPKMIPLLLWFLGLAPAVAEERPNYEADVRPILKTHCFHCHGEAGVTEGNLDLRLRKFIVRGGDSGPAVVPGDVDGSRLLKRVKNGEMPPEEDRRLSDPEIDILVRWVQQGAVTARDEPESLEAGPYFTEEERNWWSFRPVARPATPGVEHATDNPIDAFVLAKLAGAADTRGQAAPDLAVAADRATLIRRLSVDLLGLVPDPSDVRRFTSDPRPDAYHRLVDELLASPAYGERWGRHWLDVAGYADSEGYTDDDTVREHAWHYRDYVIRALNEDRAWSQFLTEQLAGDELVGWPNAELNARTIEALAATGFLRTAPDGTASGGIDQDLARNQVLADTLQIVGGSVLGLTVHCAQCHDHRYDPIPQADYYQLRAVLEPALDWKNWKTPPARRVSLYTDQDREQRDRIEADASKVDGQRQQRVDFYIERTLEQELLMVEDALQDSLRTAFRTKAADRSPEQEQLLEQHANIANITGGSLYLYDRRRDARAADLDRRRQEKLDAYVAEVRESALRALDPELRREVEAAFQTADKDRSPRQLELVKAHPAVGVTEESLANFNAAAADVLQNYADAAAEIRKFRIRDELQKLSDQAKAIRDTIPSEPFLRMLTEVPGSVPSTFVFHRGDHQQPREAVQPRGLSVLGGLDLQGSDQQPTSGRRLRFARYLTSGRHPLVARVAVNRIWAHHFGRGIVSTTGDFGVLGERPTHPELLDWLATEFVRSGWSVKQLHRLIVTSRVYRQSSRTSADMQSLDPDNRLWGRWPLRRLESELVRDLMLQVSGNLNVKMYGEPVPVMEDEVGQIVLGKENLDGERKPTNPIPLLGEEFRRSLYVQVRRTRPLSVLESFDLPDLAPHCTERPVSNVAPQALMLMNSGFVIDTSERLADRVIGERPDQPSEQLQRAWELVYSRPQTGDELNTAEAFLNRQRQAFAEREPSADDPHRAALATYCQALLGSNRFLYIE